VNGDIPSGVMSQLNISSRPYEVTALRDDGRPLFPESDYDLRAATDAEVERGGLQTHPMLRFVRLARIENGKTVVLVFRIESYHITALNDADDDFYEAAWDALVQLGFEPFTVKEEAAL
jgi:hypothetical protein